MDEGVDPTSMCQRLVDTVSRSQFLETMTDPHLLPLFEDWLAALEHEAETILDAGGASPEALATTLGIPQPGAAFLIARHQQMNLQKKERK